ncbi:prepilin-type N-terminal cleavage/methylation domain-containing protein [Candidatus Nomurabacteria bacterium]|nr:prepilin-type N-terminal cleavage/methylation domain-containing protein [Candidatus Nomurabacteria bacterium]
MNTHQTSSQSGFTLIETVIAILILSLAVGSLITLAASGFFTIRYARNQIVADNLAQEALEYVRNDRDTAFLQGSDWATWLSTLTVDDDGMPTGDFDAGCFSEDGCSVDPYTSSAKMLACDGDCPKTVLFPDEGFYGYEGGVYPFNQLVDAQPVETSYARTLHVSLPTPDQLLVEVTVEWLNGSAHRSITQSTLVANVAL